MIQFYTAFLVVYSAEEGHRSVIEAFGRFKFSVNLGLMLSKATAVNNNLK